MSLSCVLGMHDIIWNNSGPSYTKSHGGQIEILSAMSAARIAAVSSTATVTSQTSSNGSGKVFQNGSTDERPPIDSATQNSDMGFLFAGNGVGAGFGGNEGNADNNYRGQWSIAEEAPRSDGMKVAEIDGDFQALNINDDNKEQPPYQEIMPSAKKLWDNSSGPEKLQNNKGMFFQDQWQEGGGWGNQDPPDVDKSEHAISNPIMVKQRTNQVVYNGPEGMVSPRSADGNLGVCMVEYVLASSPGGTDLESRMKAINGDLQIDHSDANNRGVEKSIVEAGYNEEVGLKRAPSDGSMHGGDGQVQGCPGQNQNEEEQIMFSRTPGSRQPSPNPANQLQENAHPLSGQQTVNSSKTGSTASITSDDQVISPVHFTTSAESASLGIESLPYNFPGPPPSSASMINNTFPTISSDPLNNQMQQQQQQQQQMLQQQPQILYSPAQQQPVGVALTSNPYFVTNPSGQDPYGNNGLSVLNPGNQQAVIHPQYAYGIQSWVYAGGNNNPFMQQSGPPLQQSQQLSHSPTNTNRPGDGMNMGQQVGNSGPAGFQVIQGPLSIPAGATFYDQQGNPVIINGRVAAPITNQLGQQLRMVSPLMLNTGTTPSGQNPALQLFGAPQQQPSQQQQQSQQVSQQQRQPSLNLGYLSTGVNPVGTNSGLPVQNGGQVGVIGGHLQSSNGASIPSNPGAREQMGPMDPKRQMFPGNMGSFNSLTVNTPLANTLHVEDMNTSPLHNQGQTFNIGSPVNSSRLSAYMNLMGNSERKFRGNGNVMNSVSNTGPAFGSSPAPSTSGVYRRQGRDSSRSRLLEDFRNNRYPNLQLRDLASHIVEFSQDQHGSRFIQQKLERATAMEKGFVFNEIHGAAYSLMTDVFGNYVIQKFFEFGSPEQKLLLAQRIKGHVLPLALQMYGCRVIQKALESIPSGIQNELVRELDGHVLKCVKDQNGNHVVQKCIECVDSTHLQFIIDAFRNQVFALSTHPYGCRVIQRILEHCTPDQTTMILNELHDSTTRLVQDQYGNYVIQHVLEHGSPEEKTKIINIVRGNVLVLSQHKFASNVVEKCVSYASRPEKAVLIDEVLNYSDGLHGALYTMMKDQYANYVVQRMIDVAEPVQRKILMHKIRPHTATLRKFTYGKHILAKLEKLEKYYAMKPNGMDMIFLPPSGPVM